MVILFFVFVLVAVGCGRSRSVGCYNSEISKGVPIFFGVVKVETTRIMIVSKLLRP